MCPEIPHVITRPPTSGADVRHRTRRRGRQRSAPAANAAYIAISVAFVAAAVTTISAPTIGGSGGSIVLVSGFSTPPRHAAGREICNRPGPAPARRSPPLDSYAGVFSRRNACFASLLGATVEESAATAESSTVVNGAAEVVNGDAPAKANGAAAVSNGATSVAIPVKFKDDAAIPDAPQPTVNGGFSHTKASRAKIAAANKGKTPWNKGKARSEEVKARIAAGVRRKNRERLLQKIADMGLTEEEYNVQKKEEKRQREAERQARKTVKGGYRPTQETKDKISAILKEKWAKGEVKKRAPATGMRRKGFKHTEETKQKIRDSVRRRWNEDPEYRAKKEESARRQNSGANAREKIASTLKKKWEDPEFRAYMMEKIKQRKKPAKPSAEHREKISQAMKKKWKDDSYREKAVGNMRKTRRKTMAKNAGSRPATTTRRKTRPATTEATKPKQRELNNGIYAVVAESSPTKKVKKKSARKTKTKTSTTASGATAATKPKKKKAALAKPKKKVDTIAEKSGDEGSIEAVKPLTKPKRVFEDEDDDDDDLDDFGGDGDLAQLRHERRDLFDLLYGDDGDEAVGSNEAAIYEHAAPVAPRKLQKTTARGRPASVSPLRVPADAKESDTLAAVAAAAGGGMLRPNKKNPVFSPSLPRFSIEDDDDDDGSLDNFDPYGLEDF